MAQTFTQYFSDTFTRANAASLGSNWIPQTGGINILKIAANACTPTTDAVNCSSAFNQVKGFPYDQYAELKITTRANNNNLAGPMVRAFGFTGTSSSLVMSANGYYAGGHFAGTTYSIYKFVTAIGGGGITTGTTELATSSVTVTLNDVVRLIVQGNTLSMTVNGVAVVTTPAVVTDNDITFGYPGIFMQSNGGIANDTVTNFACGSVTSSPTVMNPSSSSNQYILQPQIAQNLGQLTATGQCVQFRVGPLSRDFAGRLQITVTGPPVLNSLWTLEGSQDGGIDWFLIPPATVPVYTPILSDVSSQYGPWYDISGMAGGSGTLFRFGCAQFPPPPLATPVFQSAVTVNALVG